MSCPVKYDQHDRLTNVTDLLVGTDLENAQYFYSPDGNLTGKIEGDSTAYYSMIYGVGTPGPHAVTTAYASNGVHTFTYDAAGNVLTEKLNGANLHAFTYDSEGHVLRRTSGTEIFDYSYDHNGNLVWKDPSGTNDGTVYVGGLYEKDLDSGVVTKYYYADGRRIAMRTSGTPYYLVTDHLGGTSVLTSTASPPSLISRTRYYPFGTVRQQEGTLVTDKLFTGQQRETTGAQGAITDEGDIYHYGARMYNASLGRFLQPDPIVPSAGDPQSLNRYAYVRNNPMRYTDPSGMFPCPGCDELKAAVEAVGTGIEHAGGAIIDAGQSAYHAGSGVVVDSWQWTWHSGRTVVNTAWGDVIKPVGLAMYSSARATGEFVADYASDKAQDTAWYVAMNRASPQSVIQNTLAYGISIGSIGNREQGQFGFALYHDCKGVCQLMSPFLTRGDAYTPGYLAFGEGHVDADTFRHENQHHIQSLMTGPAYLPLTLGSYIECWCHDEAPLERDADRARDEGIHLPFGP